MFPRLALLACLLLPVLPAHAEPAARRIKVLVMPLEPLAGVEPDLAAQVTAVLVAEAARMPGVGVQSYKEIQGALTQEQLKQAMGCDSTTCAAELAGALNTDQVIIGSLGRVGKSHLLTLARITADARTVGRSVTRFPPGEDEAILDALPVVVRELFMEPEATPDEPPDADAPPTTVDAGRPENAPDAGVTRQPAPSPAADKAAAEKAALEKAAAEKAALDKAAAEKAELEKAAADKAAADKAAAEKATPPARRVTTLVRPPKAGQQLESEVGTQPFSWVPAGTARLGCTSRKECSDDDEPAHSVTLSGFWMHRAEVTVRSYKACVDAGACRHPRPPRDQDLGCNLAQQRLDHPMNCITYAEAQKFCDWEGGRLPSSDEWEFAARAGKAQRFPWGNAALNGQRANFCDRQCLMARAAPRRKGKPTEEERRREKERQKDMALDDGHAMTAPAGSHARGANALGLLDMLGNVREWSFTQAEPARRRELIKGVSMPGFLGGTSAPEHEVLGGSWKTRAVNLELHARATAPATEWNPATGFRCMKTTPRYEK